MLDLAHALQMESAGLIVMRGALIGGNMSTVMSHVCNLLSLAFMFCSLMGQVFYGAAIS